MGRGTRLIGAMTSSQAPADSAVATAAHAPRFAFPVTLDVAGRRCVVAGGGPMAKEKVEALAAAGADVVDVPAGEFTLDLLDGAFLLVVSGEDDLDTAEAFEEAERRGVLANFLDDIPHCHVAFPSVVDRGPLKVAISSQGKAPALSRRVRIDLEERLPEALGDVVLAYHQAREAALPRTVDFATWQTAWRAALDDLDSLLALCADGQRDVAAARILATVRAGIGADTGSAADGPGDERVAS